MKEYTAKEGFKLLERIGITDLTIGEKNVFNANWDKYFKLNGKDLIGTVWELYTEVLTRECATSKNASAIDFSAKLRDTYFNKKLKEANVAKGNLEKILKE